MKMSLRLGGALLALVLILTTVVFVSLAWYEVTPVAPDGLAITSKGYVALSYQAALQYNTSTGFVDAALDYSVIPTAWVAPTTANAMTPAKVGVDAIRNSLTVADVTQADGAIVTQAARPATFRSSLQYVNRLDLGSEAKLRIGAIAYAVAKTNGVVTSKRRTSLQGDILLRSTVDVDYTDQSVEDDHFEFEYSPSTVAIPMDHYDITIQNKDALLTITTNCYFRQVDELIPGYLRTADEILLDLQVSVPSHTHTVYFRDEANWGTGRAYSYGYARVPVSTTRGSYLLAGQEGDNDLGVVMRMDPHAEENTKFVYYGLHISKPTNISLWYNNEKQTVTSNYSVTTNGVRINATGNYDVTLTISSNGKLNLAFSQSTMSVPLTEYTGEWRNDAMHPLTGFPGWYTIDVPTDAERIIFHGDAYSITTKKTESMRIDFDKPFYWEGEWHDAMPAPWDGMITVDVSNIDWFGNDGCIPYLYVWYDDGTNNGAFPGVAMVSQGNGKYEVLTDPDKEIIGAIVMRGNTAGTRMFNRTADITTITDHVITLGESDFQNCFVATFTVDVSAIDWFENDGAVPYLYAWKDDGDTYKNGDWPGVAMSKVGNVYKCVVDSWQGIDAIIISRSDGTNVWGQTSNITDFGNYTLVFDQWDSNSNAN